MTAQKKQYTNNDLWKKMDTMEGRLGAVEKWQYDSDYQKKIIADFVAEQNASKRDKDRDGLYSTLRDAGPWVLIILAGLATIIYAYASRAH